MKKSVTIDFGNEVNVCVKKEKVLIYGEKDDTKYTFNLEEIKDIYEILISFEQHGQ